MCLSNHSKQPRCCSQKFKKQLAVSRIKCAKTGLALLRIPAIFFGDIGEASIDNPFVGFSKLVFLDSELGAFS